MCNLMCNLRQLHCASIYLIFINKSEDSGGDEGIRTLETLSGLHP